MSRAESDLHLPSPDDPTADDPTAADVVITGAGMVTCLGLDRETTWREVAAGRCGMGPLTAMEQPLPPGKDGGQCPDLPADESPGDAREVRYLRRAIVEALREAGVLSASCRIERLAAPPWRCGIMIGTTLHGMRAGGQFLRSDSAEPLRHFLAGSVLRDASREFCLEGFAATTCSACSSSLGAIALGVTLLREGKLDLVVAGGYDPISEYVYGGFNSLRLVADGPLKPFARDRGGMKLAEGYAVVVLERAADARRRGATVVARVLGFGESADAHHLTQPHPQGDGAARAMAAALASAGLTAADIDLVVAHATGTPDNDAGEHAALSRVFGADLPRVPVVGFKSHLGHTLGGAGAVELILGAMALRDGVVPPCANVGAGDCEFPGLNVATGAARPARLRATLNTSLGFGGANTCMVLGLPPLPCTQGRGQGEGRLAAGAGSQRTTGLARSPSPDFSSNYRGEEEDPSPGLPPEYAGEEKTAHPASPPSTGERRADVLITGVGVVLPNAVGNDAFARLLSRPAPGRVTADSGPIPDDAIAQLLNARRVRRMSAYVKLTLAAAALAFQDAGVADVPAFCATSAAILGSTHGSSGYSAEYYGQIVRDGFPAANPLLFAEGVPNAAAAHLSLMMSVKGACQTIIGSRTAGLDALRLAVARIAQGQWDRAIVGAGEEYDPIVHRAYAHCGVYAGGSRPPAEPFAGPRDGGGFVAGCGAVTLILESRASVEARGGRVRGVVQATAGAAPVEGREADAAGRVLEELGDPPSVVSSANGTCIDRIEAAGLRLADRRTSRPAAVSSLYGHVPECFSAGPLAAVAAVLLAGRLPALFGPGPRGDGHVAGEPDEPPRSFGVLCADYAGTISGVRVGVADGAP